MTERDDGTLGDAVADTVTLEELRASLRPMTVLERVERAALGLEEMSRAELTAAKLFLGKTQPDLKAMEVTGNVEHRHTSLDALEQARQRAIGAAQESGRVAH